MKRMKTFLIYALILIGFFAVSVLLENGLVMSMYKDIVGNFHGEFEDSDTPFGIENMSANASSVNGNLKFDLINNTGKYIDQGYIKVDLYNTQMQRAATKYIPISGMQENASKTYNVKFKANNIKGYNISVVKELPDKTNIIDILGWEIDLSNVFGLGIDLTNVTIFGNKLTDIFSASGLSDIFSTGVGYGKSFWWWFRVTAEGVPPWAYFIAWMFIAGVL